jgi:aspartyl protease family protein
MLRMALWLLGAAVIAALWGPDLLKMPGPVDQPVAPAVAAVPSAGARLGDVVIPADARGQFTVTGKVDGRSFAMLADTGATTVALRASTARSLGIFPAPADFTTAVSTANGQAFAAPVTLATLAVGRIELRRVEALVLPDEALGVNLLGMSFLKRLSSFHMVDGRLVLTQ